MGHHSRLTSLRRRKKIFARYTRENGQINKRGRRQKGEVITYGKLTEEIEL